MYDFRGLVSGVSSTDPGIVGKDVLTGGKGGDVLIGGSGNDTITGGSGNDVAIGDNGQASFVGGVLVSASTLYPNFGGDDTIAEGRGNDIVLGGFGNDRVSVGDGTDIVLGDNGQVALSGGFVMSVTSTDPSYGGNDVIAGGNGPDVILGGSGNDTITGGTGNSTILGDNGTLTYASSGSGARGSTLTSTSPTLGGNDVIAVVGGTNVIVGGTGNDTINGGSGTDLILGDHARVTTSAGQAPTFATTFTDAASGNGNDLIRGGSGKETIYGGSGDDTIFGGSGTDILNGGNTSSGGADGFDMVFSGPGSATFGSDLPAGLPTANRPPLTFQVTTDFSNGLASRLTPAAGAWSVIAGRYQGNGSSTSAISNFTLNVAGSSYVEFQSTVNTRYTAGLVFDYHSATDYKFAALLPGVNQVVIGHATSRGLVNDLVVSRTAPQGVDAVLGLVLKGNVASVYLNGASALSFTYSGALSGGHLGLMSRGGPSQFDNVIVRGNSASAASGTI